jgi:hypothetical protein
MEKRRPGRPATGQTKPRSVRVGDVWDEAHAIALGRGDKFAEIIEAALRRYVQRHRRTDAAS